MHACMASIRSVAVVLTIACMSCAGRDDEAWLTTKGVSGGGLAR